jgi:uncharacterized membrane protein YkoI
MKIVFFLMLASFASLAAKDVEKKALELVPDGKIEATKKDEVVIKTKAGTLVEVELNRDGSLDEASGHNALKDNFTPGAGLLTLDQAVKKLKEKGKDVSGEWSLDKDLLRDWEYEFEGIENGKQYEYSLNARTGELVKSDAD